MNTIIQLSKSWFGNFLGPILTYSVITGAVATGLIYVTDKFTEIVTNRNVYIPAVCIGVSTFAYKYLKNKENK